MHRFSILILAVALWVALPRGVGAGKGVSYKFQHYKEGDDRVDVIAHYASAQVDLSTAAKLSIVGLVDVITGATPTGATPDEGSEQVPLARLEDTRYAGMVDFEHAIGDGAIRAEYAYSHESDYISNGLSIGLSHDFNKRNTTVRWQFAYTDDDIQPGFFDTPRNKLSRDLLVGITQLLGSNTVITANLSYGNIDGYLSDPYKIVSKTVEIVPGFPLKLSFPENRPDHREKWVGFLEGQHMFEAIRGSIDVSGRYYTDDHGVDSGTLAVAWFQRFGERWIVRPSLRWYRQSAADYYHFDLDQTSIDPSLDPDGSAPHYSSDYRLSAFDATTFGLKVIYLKTDSWAVDAAYERYTMRGRDSVTPSSAYVTANIITLGLRAWF